MSDQAQQLKERLQAVLMALERIPHLIETIRAMIKDLDNGPAP